MNQNFVLIKIITFFEKIIRKTSIDFEALITILKLKLTLDDRKPSVSMSADSSKQKLTGMKANLLMQAFVGLFLGFFMFLPLDLFYKVTVIVSMDLFFMIMYMISDFSGVLLDIRDKNIIMTKPVNSQTMNAARIIHIIYYMLMMFLALNLASIVIGVIKHGALFLLCYLFMMFFLSFFIVFLTTILYSMLLNRFNGEKLKDIINIFQIVLSVVTIVAYQLMGRIFEFVDMNIQLSIKWWTFLIPSTWFAGLFKVVVDGDFAPHFVAMAVMSILVPIVLGTVLIKNILPKFENYLAKLQIEDGVFIRKNGLLARMKEMIYQKIAKNNVERAFMRFTDYNLSRDRRLKLMLYPNLTMSFIFPFIILLPLIQGHTSIAQGIMSLKGSAAYISLYLTLAIVITNFEYLQYSDCSEASFIYDSFPIESKRVIYKGAMKAYYIKYMLPAMFFLSVIFTMLCGLEALPGLVFLNIVSVLILTIRVNNFKMGLPFSKAIGTTANKDLSMTLSIMAIAGGFALLHFSILKNSNLFTAIACVVVIIFIFYNEYHANKKYLKQMNTDYSMS